MAVFKDCHQTSPKVLLKWWLSLKIVIKHLWLCFCGGVFEVVVWWCFCGGVFKHRPKFYWSDGCRKRLSSNICGCVFEVVFWWRFCGVFVVVFLWCFQTSPKFVPKSWLSSKIVIKHRPKFYWSDVCLKRLSSNIAQSSTEVMSVWKDCHQRLPKGLLKWWLSLKTVINTAEVVYIFKTVINTAEVVYVFVCVCVCVLVCVCVCHQKSVINSCWWCKKKNLV